MNKNELRFGNLLQDRLGNLCRVEEINKNEFKAPTIHGPITAIPNKPIILTETWLIKFGFKKNNNWFSNDLFEIDIESRGLHVRLIMGGSSKYLLHIKYVHQLQNLYFALTGEELTME